MSAPLFTVVTITYNSSKWVGKAIETVLASHYHDFEYLICDDCSTDDTWNIINTYSDPRIKTFRHDQNGGEYPNRNFALQKSAGKYMLFVDGDDELFPDTLGKLAGYIERFPEAGSIWGAPESECDFCILPKLLYPEEITKWIYLANIRLANIGLAETLFKTELLKHLGGFSTKYISSDTHMKKLCALESPVLIVPPGMVYWRVSEGQASSRLKVNYNGFKNNVAIDQEVLPQLKKKTLDIPFFQVEKNIRIRNIKLLFKHTFLKGKIGDGIGLFKEFDFKIFDLLYLFKKGDYSYKKYLQESHKELVD